MTRVSSRRQPRPAARRLDGVRILLPLLALLALTTACASAGTASGGSAAAPTTDTADPAAGGGIEQADNDLQVEYDPADGTEPQTWTLTCVGFAEGSHPDPEAACAQLKAMDEPFAPLPADVICTEQYGGPQTARILGRWNGEPVDLDLSLTDGCRIDQWHRLSVLVPVPVMAVPTEVAPSS
jgi:Subtilisin inhibitor-like